MAKAAGVAAGIVAAAVALTPLVVPVAVGAAGFGAVGVLAGSPAAALMSTYGGVVTAGSLCATLQSVGAAGLATSTVAAAEAVAAGLGGLATWCFTKSSKSAQADAADPSADDAVDGDAS